MLDLNQRKRKAIRLPLDNARKKYSTIPHPLLRLTRSALPAETSPAMIQIAVEAFSASVACETQSGYATAARHYISAEKSLREEVWNPIH